MCGIAAIVGMTPGKDAALRRMLDALIHRGPDGEGTFSADTVVLGHRRLAIIDIDGGKQPLSNSDGTVHLVCNGEIYNYRSLRREFEAERYAFQTASDCEVIIALYEKYGDALVDHLRGMFAFALWDSRRQRLLVARDHLGQKPLFYATGRYGFACASEIKALLACEQGQPRMNLEALDQYLALRLIDAPHTMFEGIRKLPPGHLLVLEKGGTPQIRRYWDLAFGPQLAGSDESLCDELEEILDETLRLHRVSDVPVGAFLSGGLDSSLIVAMLTRRLGVKALPTFTMGLDYKRFDESPAARRVARLFGTEHHESRVQPAMIALLPELVNALDEPSDPLSLCTWLLARFTRQYVKVTLGGDGGDELFGGYDRYYGNVYAGLYRRVPAVLRRHVIGPALARLPAKGWYKSVGHQARWLHHLSFQEGSARYASSLSYSYFDASRRQRLYTREAGRRAAAFDAEDAIRRPYEAAEGSALVRMLYADIKVRLPNHPVMITDRICMAHGLEVRSPYMDHKLAEFAARLPDAQKVRGRSLRRIQMKLASRYLPPDMLARPKQGFSSALPYMLQKEYSKLSTGALAGSRLVRDGIFDHESVRELTAEHDSGRADHGNRIWLLINAEIWYRLRILGESSDDLRRELAAAA